MTISTSLVVDICVKNKHCQTCVTCKGEIEGQQTSDRCVKKSEMLRFLPSIATRLFET
jgi:hypothetical protein